jgi:hypothetical protein
MSSDIGMEYDMAMFERYFALQNSAIFQKLLAFTFKQNLPDLTGKIAYDNGVGAGFCLDILLNRGLVSYTALDLSEAMFSTLAAKAKANDPSTEVTFVHGDNTLPISHGRGPFDIVVSSYAMYVDSYSKLMGFTHHLFSAVNENGMVLLQVIHADYEHTSERTDYLENNGHDIRPKLPLDCGSRFPEYSKYEIHCTTPYFDNELSFLAEFVVGRATLRQALREAGFRTVVEVPFESEPGFEHLLPFVKHFGLGFWKCCR